MKRRNLTMKPTTIKVKKKTLKKKDKHNTIECSPPPEQSTSSTNRRQSGSDIAKKGYKEEQLVCDDLNNNEELRKALKPILGDEYDECVKVPGTGKIDIKSKNGKLLAQVKKSKKNQFQQLARLWIDCFIDNIPELNSVKKIFKEIFEYPLLPNGTHIDKEKSLKKLSITDYSQEELDEFLILLNNNKKKIVEFAFYGDNLKEKPDYLFSIQYVGKKSDEKRDHILLFKIKDIIKYLLTLDFVASKKKTVIWLGSKNPFTLQRKGGDNGEKASNNLQIKLTPSKLVNEVEHIKYKL